MPRSRRPTAIEPDDVDTPCNLDAERAVLASCLLRREAATAAVEQLEPDDFWRDAHQRIFRAMGIVAERQMIVDLVTVHEILEQRGESEAVGGRMYMMALVDGVAITANIDSYCAILIDMRHRRKLLHISQRLAAEVKMPTSDAPTLAAQAEGWLAETMQARGSRDLLSFADVLSTFLPTLEARVAQRQEIAGITSGFAGINELTRGFHAEDLTIVAGRPGMGKSSLMLNMVCGAVDQGKYACVFSLEMSRERLLWRLLSARSGVSLFKIQKGCLSADDLRLLSDALVWVAESPMYLDDTPGTTVAQILYKCRALRGRHGLDIVYIDYVGLLKPRNQRIDNRQAEVAEISLDLKEMARKLRVPVVALSQLSRQVESRQNKRPMLSDLRESGSLEQDADNVAFVYRPEIYTHKPDDVGKAEYILAKHRDGEVGTVRLQFKKEIVRFYDDEDTAPIRDVPPPNDADAAPERYERRVYESGGGAE